jgi:hypothetical protein
MDLAGKYNGKAFLTSAKTGKDVEQVFKELATAMAQKLKE